MNLYSQVKDIRRIIIMNDKRPFTFIILVFLSTFAAVCGILFTPALPEIAQYLSITPGESQKSVSVFLVGYAFGFLPWGPVANDIGRKKTTLIGVSIAIVGILVSMLIHFFPHDIILNTGRFFTALGSSVGVKITYTYLSDLYSKEQILNKISYLIIATAASTSLATALGGFLTSDHGWISCFTATLLYAVLIFICSLFLPETLKAESRIPLKGAGVIQGYAQSFKNTALLKSSLIMGSCTSFTYLFASLAPFIVIKEMGLNPKQYGIYNFIPGIGIILGFYIIQLLREKLSHFAQIKIGIFITFLAILFISYEFFLNHAAPLNLFIAMALIYVGIAVIFANSSTLALSTSEDKSNTSAVMNFMNMSFCCFNLFIVEAIPLKASLLMPANFFLLGVGLIMFWWILQKDTHFKKSEL